MILTTTNCRRFNHPEFVLEADEAHVSDVHLKKIVRDIEMMVSQGSVFKTGQTFQIGWMLTRVESFDDSRLTLHEPDMKAMPMRFVPGITETLRQMMVQLYALDSFSLRNEIDIPSAQQSLLVCTQYTEPNFFMERLTPDYSNKNDTGWFVGCFQKGHDHNIPENLRCISVYDAFLGQHGIQNFLAFPVGSMILVDQERGLKIWKNGEALSLAEGSFIDEFLNRPGLDQRLADAEKAISAGKGGNWRKVRSDD